MSKPRGRYYNSVTVSENGGSANYIVRPTASIRRLGWFFRLYQNRHGKGINGEWVDPKKVRPHDPRKLPVPIIQFEYGWHRTFDEIILIVVRAERYECS